MIPNIKNLKKLKKNIDIEKDKAFYELLDEVEVMASIFDMNTNDFLNTLAVECTNRITL